MAKLYSDLRPVEDEMEGSWSIWATYYEDDLDANECPIGPIEWEVPEWTGLDSEEEALEVIERYKAGKLPSDLRPVHPHQHT